MGDCFIEAEQRYTEKTGNTPPAGVTQSQNIWPSDAPWWREGLYQYFNAVLPIALKLVRVIALWLDLDERAFDSLFTFPITGMRPVRIEPPSASIRGQSLLLIRLLTGRLAFLPTNSCLRRE
jgi:isopenicillin N synthase-like dioxygenase